MDDLGTLHLQLSTVILGCLVLGDNVERLTESILRYYAQPLCPLQAHAIVSSPHIGVIHRLVDKLRITPAFMSEPRGPLNRLCDFIAT